MTRAIALAISASVLAGGLGACDGPGASSDIDVDSSDLTATSLRVAAGATTSYADGAGHAWLSDRRYSGGLTYALSPPHTISRTADPTLYQAERYGADANGAPASFSYAFRVVAGDYNVSLLFSEGWVKGPGERRFGVTINGAPVLREFDIFAEAGGADRALVRTFPVHAADGSIVVRFEPGSVQNPKVNALEIVRVAGPPAPDAGAADGAPDGTPPVSADDAGTTNDASAPVLDAGAPKPPPGPATCPKSLQAAVHATATGGTLNVVGCSFKERVTIDKSMTLLGGAIDGTGLGVPLQAGALTVAASDVKVSFVHVFGSGGAGIGIAGGARVTVTDSEFDHNIQEGYSADGEDLLFLRVHFHHNNEALTVDPEWEAGGGKAHGSRIVFDGCESDHNGGPGFWYDTWYPKPYPPDRVFNTGAVVKNSRAHDNFGSGIMFEVSDGAMFTDNVTWNNGNPKHGWFWEAGILVSSSRNVEVARNVVAYNLNGISVVSQERDDRPPGNTTGVNVHDNIVIQSFDVAGDSAKAMLAYAQDWAGPLYAAQSGNVSARNRFYSVYPEPRDGRFVWSSSMSTLAQLNATPIGGGSTYITKADADQALLFAGLPGL
jgi:hypothetical protein